MANLVVCAVHDSAIDAFGRPIFVPHVGAAVRSFVDEVNRADGANQLYGHSSDFILYQLAEFEESTGIFIQNADTKRVLARGKDVRNQPGDPA